VPNADVTSSNASASRAWSTITRCFIAARLRRGRRH